jgi:S1-C subfamily serine protease
MVMVLCIIFIVVVVAHVHLPQLSQTEMIAKSMQSIVAVHHPTIGIPASGFYIGNGVFVTAGHVAGMEGIEKVVTEDGVEYPVIEQLRHPDYDCGFLIVKDANCPILKFDVNVVRRGEEIFILGNPADLTFISTKGIVTGRTDCGGYFGDISLIVVDAVANNGNSGSALLDIDGEVRGVHVGGRGDCGYDVSVCVSDIFKALEVVGLQRPNSD